MPRPRKSSAALRLVGAHKEHPGRMAGREGEPVNNALLGDPPDHMSAEEVEIWHEIKGKLVPGIALASDSGAFEMLCGLMAASRRGPLKGYQYTALGQLFSKFGMTPADRNRVAVPPRQDASNPFARLPH